MSGLYRCKVYNNRFTEFSNAATLTLYVPSVPTYLVAVTGGTGGGWFEAGAIVTLTANTPETGKEFTNWTLTGVTVEDYTLTSITFKMPASAVTAEANFRIKPYTVTVENGAGSGEYEPGATVNIIADEPQEGMEFVKWVVEGVTLSDDTQAATSFIMPENGVKAAATYRKIIPLTGLKLTDARTMSVGEAARLTVYLKPENTTQTELVWQNGDKNVLSVENGVVKALSPGVSVVTVTSAVNPAISVNCEITVAPVTLDDMLPRELVMKKGKKLNLNALAGKRYGWTSGDETIAKVNQAGTVKAKKKGSVTLTGTMGARAKSAAVGDVITVKLTVVESGAVDNIKISIEKLSLTEGETKTVKAVFKPVKTTYKDVLWFCADPSVAVADAMGNVTGVSVGETTLTAVASSGVNDSIKVKVTSGVSKEKPKATAIKFANESRAQAISDETALTVLATPANADISGIVWSTSDDSVASVDEATGLITGVALGKATITATLGELAAMAEITVREADAREENLGLTVDFLAVENGKSLKLDDLSGFIGAWESEDAKIAKITKGKTLKIKKIGETYITFTVAKVQKKNARFMNKALLAGDTARIKLIAVKQGEAVKKIVLTGESVIQVDAKTALGVEIKPAAAIYKQVWFASSDPKIASVDAEGNVTGVSQGTATITATATSGKTAAITLTVAGEVKTLKLKVGETYNLQEKSASAQAEWKSKNKKIATVDESGKIKARKKGKTTITATTEDGRTRVYEVTVK